ncbi:MAG: type II toxin-antitoxin system VapC family toxin [Hormoscilla sp. GM102CHS1]|nr:type II toxin-antitoxin system VapC family toxin [Hormoscilla sp. GM102CHS1]
MSFWILDTDHVSLFQHRHPLVIQRVNAVNSEDIGLTVITVEEQMRGWLNAIRQSSRPDRLLWAYIGLRTGVEFFNGVNLLDFDRDAYDCYADLIRQRIRIGTQDLRIAAIALSRNAILVTRNRRDFARVPDLRLDDWTIA